MSELKINNNVNLPEEQPGEIVVKKNVVIRSDSAEGVKPVDGLLMNGGPMSGLILDGGRVRTISQPGPMTGPFMSAAATRAARKRPPRNVNYAGDEKREAERPVPRAIIQYKGDDSGNNTPRDTGSPLPTFRGASDNRSLTSNRVFAATNDIRGISTPRKRSVTTIGDAISIRSVDTQAPTPTNPKVNKKITRDYMTSILSCIYAIFLVTIGVIIYIFDTVVDEVAIGPIYNLVLTVIGYFYMLYLIYDIHKYKSVMHKNEKLKIAHLDQMESFYRKQEDEYGSVSAEIPPPQELQPVSHDYCFSEGRHSGSFYLKLGATGFALGHLIHSVLLITRQVNFLVDDDVDTKICLSIPQVILDVINPLYVFFQLYFIFKYSNVIILKRQNLARLAFMHFLGSSLCFWVSTIVRETILSLTLYAQKLAEKDKYDQGEDSSSSEEMFDNKTSLFDVAGLYDERCSGSSGLNNLIQTVSPYLYPFTVEFNILIVGVFYIVWRNIGNCVGEGNDVDDSSSLYETKSYCKIPTATEDNDYTSNIVIYADCHASNRGIFLGMISIVLIIGIIIIAFIFSSIGDEYQATAYLITDVTKLFLHSTLLVIAVVAYNQTRKLDINEHSLSLLDDLLLFICLPAFFTEALLSAIATVTYLNIIRTIDFVIMAVQVVVQTPLIVDGLRRCSNSRKLRRYKPGRELVMFLLIANVGMWIHNTFSFKSSSSLDERYVFYGKVVWSIVGHLTLPLIMFYRFHSSVCFADIWSHAYQPGEEH